jgi:helicase
MKKQDTYDLARRFLQEIRKPRQGQLSLAFDGLPATSANEFLAEVLENRVAAHNADLMDEERDVVERYLLNGKLDVVFATTTLAAGVNFPLGAAIFADWSRWDGDRRVYVPIDTGSFHNMAGRVGRMGYAHESGRVIFVARDDQNLRAARPYLNLGTLPSLEPRIGIERFDQLALQLVASRLCTSRAEIEHLICTTLSALREQERNPVSFATWPTKMSQAVDSLVKEGLLMQTAVGGLSATPVGRALGHSGLVPQTGLHLLNFIVTKAARLTAMLPTPAIAGDVARFAFSVVAACLSSPEFRPAHGKQPTRFIPYPLGKGYLFDADIYRDDLAEPVWQADAAPINGAKLCMDWIDGAEIRLLESTADRLSAGMLREMYRDVVWILQGLAAILVVAADKTVPTLSRPLALRSDDSILDLIARLPRAIRRLSFRVATGLPDDLLWMPTLNALGSTYHLNRSEMLALRREKLATPELVMLGSTEADSIRVKVFDKAKPSPVAKANWLRDTCRTWKQDQRKRAAERHLRRARHCKSNSLVESYYKAVGTDFEVAFEAVLAYLKIPFQRLDDRTKTGAPDYLLTLDRSAIILELKSKQGDHLVDYNKAVEVLSASEVHGHKNTFCVTLCQPGIDPSVPGVIAACGRLSVVESNDLGEAFLRICEGTLNQAQLWRWLATPGQALAADLPYAEYA